MRLKETVWLWSLVPMMMVTFAPSLAQAKEKVVILKPDSDDAKATELTALQNALEEEWKAREEYSLLPTPDADVLDLAFDAECLDTDDECFSTIGKSLSADLVVYASMAGGKANIRVIDVNKGTEKAAFMAAGGAGVAAAVAAGMAGSFGEKPAPVVAEAPKPKPKPQPEPKPEPKKVEGPEVSLTVNTTPADAFVYLNNKRVGKSPLTLKKPAGTYTLRILKPGYGDSVREVVLSKPPVVLNVKMDGDGGAAAVAVVAPVKTVAPGADRGDEEFYETWWFWTSVGAGVALLSVGIAAGAGAFDSPPVSTGDLNFVFDNGAEKDFRVQALRR